MTTITTRVRIVRPAEEVFAYLSDMEHLMEWVQGVARVTRTPDGPTQLGTVFDCAGTLGGMAMTGAYRIEACDAPERLVATGAFASMRFVDDWRFAEVAGETQVEQRTDLLPQGLMKVFMPLIGPVMGRQFHRDLLRLKRILEAGPCSRSTDS